MNNNNPFPPPTPAQVPAPPLPLPDTKKTACVVFKEPKTNEEHIFDFLKGVFYRQYLTVSDAELMCIQYPLEEIYFPYYTIFLVATLIALAIFLIFFSPNRRILIQKIGSAFTVFRQRTVPTVGVTARANISREQDAHNKTNQPSAATLVTDDQPQASGFTSAKREQQLVSEPTHITDGQLQPSESTLVKDGQPQAPELKSDQDHQKKPQTTSSMPAKEREKKRMEIINL